MTATPTSAVAPPISTASATPSSMTDRCREEAAPSPTSIEDLLHVNQAAHADLAGLDRLFVIGCGKSGTTWLRNLLNGHPQIAVYGEGSFAWRLIPFLTQAFSAFNQHQHQGQPSCTELTEPDLLLTARLLIDNTFYRYIQESGKTIEQLRVVGDKTPQHTIGIPILNRLYPQARFIHIYRDPRDVATSGWFHDGVNDPKRDFPQFIQHFMNEVWPLQVGTARQVGPTLGRERYLEIRYEDLLGNESNELGRMLDFLGVENTTALVEQCSSAGSFKKMSGGRSRGEADNTKFYRKGVAGDWKNHLPPELVKALCVPIADLMRECGYEPTR